jgi:nitroimidazol reductase NimA-like FMN-containing flavoprotein (pyridoxamine 5'-phosphate oxidase superfamily)
MTDVLPILRNMETLFQSQRFAVLATQADGQPYANLVSFAATRDLRQIVFATARATRKFANLCRDGRVALMIDDRTNQRSDLGQATAVCATGRAMEADDPDGQALYELLLAKNPELTDFLNISDCAVIRVDVQRFTVVSEFEKVVVLDLDGDSFSVVENPD